MSGKLAFAALGAAVLALFFLQHSSAGPGGLPVEAQEEIVPDLTEKSISQNLFTATGRLALSVDGGGSDNSSFTVQAQKPSANAKVRQAFLMGVSTGQRNYQIPNGVSGLRFEGSGITWTRTTASSIGSWNYAADVTPLVKPNLDAAPVGRRSFSIVEGDTALIEGAVLAVVFDDPSQTRDSTVTLLFGAQNTNGDSFAINLASPLQPSAPGTVLNMGLGISWGAQGCSVVNNNQFSTIEVNGQRLSSSAGGQDDGICFDGGLMTVGGLDDSTANPANPFGGHNSNPRTDDELYSLLPFITGSTTQINVATRNPSNDDNIFFAYFQISGSATVTPTACVANATTLCIDDLPGDRRFQVKLAYSSSQNGGINGDGRAIALNSLGVPRGGLFWFFSNDNPEMLVKVLNGCSINNHFWVFYSAGTNVGFELSVVDTKASLLWTSRNPDLTLAQPVADLQAFSCP